MDNPPLPSNTHLDIPSPTSSTPPIVIDTIFLLLLRFVYFLLSRRFLLSTLNPTLRDLSKPETLLPATEDNASDASTYNHSRTRIPHSSSIAMSTDVEFEQGAETEDDGLLSNTSQNSSYPPSPSRSHVPLPPPLPHSNSGREPFIRRNTDDGFLTPVTLVSQQSSGGSGGSGEASGSGSLGNAIELQNLGQKLREVGAGVGAKVPRVLHISHGRRGTAQDGGTQGLKKTTRELNRVSRVLFSLCFAESCNLITLVMFHSLGILHSKSRHVNFSVSLHVLLAMILLVVPLVQCLLLTYRSRESATPSTTPSRSSSLPFTSRLLISLIPFTLYMIIFSRIPPYVTTIPSTSYAPSEGIPVPEIPDLEDMDPEAAAAAASTAASAAMEWATSAPEGWEGQGWLAPSLGRVVVLGVVVLGMLSGLGAIRTAWEFFEHAAGTGSRQLTDNDILQAERSLYRVRHDLVAKRDEINRLNDPGMQAEESRSGGWMGKVFGGNGGQEVAALQAELKGLQAMEFQVSRSLKAMKIRKKRQGFGNTLQGKLYNIAGYVFAIYCVARLLMCLTSIFLPHFSTSQIPSSSSPQNESQKGKGNTNGDWISFLIALGLSQLPIDVDVAVWSRGISLLLTGLLILSSLAQVLRSVSRILRLTSKTVGAGFLLLGLGQLFSTYVISLLVQLRTSLPPSPMVDTDPFSPFYSNTTQTLSDNLTSTSTSIGTSTSDSLLSTLPDFRVFGRLFDSMFLLAAAGTGLYRYIAMKINGADDSGDIYNH